ncbi:3'-5' exonuclease [Luteibaculum oceani]|uniref:3'-5' exonuclease domain-containing protein 2 n=1 Tax=Luteibaculum oceani TaxID=1294296 RepID=A0A5C6V1Z2_9FLAO|nr:3'-5' exonuclease [Luteibaculum oceani]TXC77035.1 3'-5' exonuclease domain-containing protein 2 [Luteibaculum oceani]
MEKTQQLYEIQKDEIQNYPLDHYRGEIVLVDNQEGLREFYKEDIFANYDVIGFDTESKPSFKKGQVNKLALFQFATPHAVYLVRLNKIGGIPEKLASMMRNYHGTMVGISLADDWREIRKLKIDAKPECVIDLNELAMKKGFVSIGAKKLSALLLGIRISKRQQVSNWEADELSEPQMIYAATDAWICRGIYFKLLTL